MLGSQGSIVPGRRSTDYVGVGLLQVRSGVGIVEEFQMRTIIIRVPLAPIPVDFLSVVPP
jgi:hypothetical protein